MAVTAFTGGFMFDTAADAVLGKFAIQNILVKKVTTNGTVTLSDVDDTTVFVSPTIAAGVVVPIVFHTPWPTNGIRLKAIGAGTAEVTVFYADPPKHVATV